MTISERQKDFIWVGQKVGTLVTSLGTVISDWANDLAKSAKEARPTGSPVSNACAESPKPHTPAENPADKPKPPTPSHPEPIAPAPLQDEEPDAPEPMQTEQPGAESEDDVPVAQQPSPKSREIDEIGDAARPRKKRRDLDFVERKFVRPPMSSEPRMLKTGKRVRVNWSEFENNALFETTRRFPHMREEDLLIEIVSALGGSRTRFQTKGRFRNLLASGRIRASETTPKQWIVMHNANVKMGHGAKENAAVGAVKPRRSSARKILEDSLGNDAEDTASDGSE